MRQVAAEIVATQQLENAGLFQLRGHAFVRAGQHHAHLAPLQISHDLFQRLQAGDVDERHPAQSQDHTSGSV